MEIINNYFQKKKKKNSISHVHICLLVPPSDPNQYSWGENYAGSSGLMSVSPDMNPMQRARSGTVSLQSRRTDASVSSSTSTFHCPVSL